MSTNMNARLVDGFWLRFRNNLHKTLIPKPFENLVAFQEQKFRKCESHNIVGAFQEGGRKDRGNTEITFSIGGWGGGGVPPLLPAPFQRWGGGGGPAA